MIRRIGEHAINVFTFVVFISECLALSYLTWRFIQRFNGWVSFEGLMRSLTGAVVLTAALLVGFMFMIVLLHATIRIRENALKRQIEQWTNQLFPDLLSHKGPPQTLPFSGQLALLSLRETLRGEESELALSWIREKGLPRLYIGKLRKLGSRTSKINTLELIAKARIPEAIPELVMLLKHRSSLLRIHTSWALGRCISDQHRSPEEWVVPKEAIAIALSESGLTAGLLEKSLILMGDNARFIILELLKPEVPLPILCSAINAAGLLELLELAEPIGRLLNHPNPEVKAATLRFCNKVGLLPDGAEEILEQNLQSPVEFVRVQSVRALVLVAPARATVLLHNSLTDASWWVRRASAECLEQLGPVGLQTLRYCAYFHQDRFARQTCLQLMLDRGWIKVNEANRLWETT